MQCFVIVSLLGGSRTGLMGERVQKAFAAIGLWTELPGRKGGVKLPPGVFAGYFDTGDAEPDLAIKTLRAELLERIVERLSSRNFRGKVLLTVNGGAWNWGFRPVGLDPTAAAPPDDPPADEAPGFDPWAWQVSACSGGPPPPPRPVVMNVDGVIDETVPRPVRRHHRHRPPVPHPRRPSRLRAWLHRVGQAAAGWIISLLMHSVVALILLCIVVVHHFADPPVSTRTVELVGPDEEIILADFDREVVADQDLEVVDRPSATEELAVDDFDLGLAEAASVEVPDTEPDTPRSMEALRTSSDPSTGAFMALGTAPAGAFGSFGHRRGVTKQRALKRFGGSTASETAVTAALRWFQRHQSDNGQWDADGYPVNCKLDGPKCEPDNDYRQRGDLAITGYALLCFLGAGHDHVNPGQFSRTVGKGLSWLIKRQRRNGSWGDNYLNGICTMAVAEAYAMTGDEALRGPAQRGVNYLLRVQNPGQGEKDYGGSGWDYVHRNPNRNDSSVTGWCVMALKSAAVAGLDVGDGLAGARWWLEHAYQASNPRWEDYDRNKHRAIFPYVYNERRDRSVCAHLSCVGALCAVFLGYDAENDMLATLVNDIFARHLDKSRKWPTDSYYLYYNTLAVFQFGGHHWTTWNGVVRDMLVDSQEKGDGCLAGSWDPQGHNWGMGRGLVTAYACLSLEVYYRYLPAAMRRN